MLYLYGGFWSIEVTNEIESKYCLADHADCVWSNLWRYPFGAALVFSGLHYRLVSQMRSVGTVSRRCSSIFLGDRTPRDAQQIKEIRLWMKKY